jgi:hypothetical protein
MPLEDECGDMEVGERAGSEREQERRDRIREAECRIERLHSLQSFDLSEIQSNNP